MEQPAPIDDGPLGFGERPVPEPGAREIRVKVSVCGVCRTDLHLAEGDLPVHRPGTTPGHEIVGIVDALGAGAARFPSARESASRGSAPRAGRAASAGAATRTSASSPLFTGWDADGGFAEYAVVDERFAYALPDSFADDTAAPLLCAGIIGYRALRRAELPRGGRLGIYGYGASAHLAAQVALHEGAEVHVLTRSAAARSLALELGATSAGDAYDAPPQPLDAAILFAPVGDLVPVALRALDRGGTLAIAGIHLSDIPVLDYERDLFEERQVRSVTANTRRDGEEFLALADRIHLRPAVTRYPLSGVARALSDVANDRLTGAAVVVVNASATPS